MINHESAAALSWGSFIGDALALGPHWEYDPAKIVAKFGRVENYQAPMTSYHPGKQAGDFTHYGDQALVLLRSLATAGGYDSGKFSAAWRAFWENPDNRSYRDGATRQTLQHLQEGRTPGEAGSDSHDIGGAGRIAPLFLLHDIDEATLISVVREETALTHPRAAVVEAAEFFCRVALQALQGASIPEALDRARAAHEWQALPTMAWDAVRESATAEETDAEALQGFGLSCPVESAFPGICHLLLRHPEDPVKGLVENVNAGGDSAARGLILGLVYGAKFGTDKFPVTWLDGLRAGKEIGALMGELA